MKQSSKTRFLARTRHAVGMVSLLVSWVGCGGKASSDASGVSDVVPGRSSNAGAPGTVPDTAEGGEGASPATGAAPATSSEVTSNGDGGAVSTSFAPNSSGNSTGAAPATTGAGGNGQGGVRSSTTTRSPGSGATAASSAITSSTTKTTTANGGAVGTPSTGGSSPATSVAFGGASSSMSTAFNLGGYTAAAGAPPGAPTISDDGYVKVATGKLNFSGFVSSYVGGSGSSIALEYDATSFCASGSVGASASYHSWAGVGFNVNQAQSGSSGSTGGLPLVGDVLTVTYVNNATSQVEFQLWDGSKYWCHYLPVTTVPTTVNIPFSSLKTQCWNDSGDTFASGTPITTVQLVAPGAATAATPFDFCFMGMSVI